MRSVTLPVLASVALIAALGVAHGVATDRWAPSRQLERSLATLERVPTTFGDWSSEEIVLDPESMARAGIKGWVHRRYRNTKTRESVALLVVCGRGGPISVHTPDVCYAGAGYRPTSDPAPKDLDCGEAGKQTFRVSRFSLPGGVSQTQLEIYLAWSRDGRVWEAPQNPRLSLARSPALYKMYVVREFLPNTRAEGVGSCQTFLRRAILDIAKALPSE